MVQHNQLLAFAIRKQLIKSKRSTKSIQQIKGKFIKHESLKRTLYRYASLNNQEVNI